MTTRARSASDTELLLGALLLVVAYLATRAILYDQLPIIDAEGEHDWGRWFIRDVWMSIPRLCAFGGCLFLIAHHGDWRRWGWQWRAPVVGTVLLAIESLSFVFGYLARRPELVFTPLQVAQGWFTTLPVALFEETCFRGIIFTALTTATRLAPNAAAVASSAVFMVYHVQAQSVTDWPGIFLFGYVACAARHLGTALPWLILVHEIVDGLWFHLGAGGPAEPELTLRLVGWGCALVAAAWAMRVLRETTR